MANNTNSIAFWHPASLIATVFGIGKIPFASGTFGSLAAYPIFFVMVYYFTHAAHSLAFIIMISTLILLILFIAGTISAHIYAVKSKKDDPKAVVIDEVVGQLLTLYLTFPLCIMFSEGPGAHTQAWVVLLIASVGPFLLFRLFDIVKPWPISWCDQNIKGGIGIMLDDILAAVMAIVAFDAILIVLLDQKML